MYGVYAASNKQPVDISIVGNNDGSNKALDFQITPSYHLPTYTIFPPVKLPSFQEWKQQSSGKKESEEEDDKREKWEFPLLQTEENQEGPPMPKINIFPQQQPKGLFFKDKGGRFNYADASCGAKVLKTNKNAKSKNNILKKDKDSYLMNECSYSEKFIEIELCDTIWVTSVIMGNLELYSSNFNEIKISVSKNYPPNPEDGWNEISTYTSNNWKQLQRFNTATVLGKSIKKQFVKYLRIDLKSHYGNEFYCPITQVIVHGVTMLEDHRRKGKNHELFEEEEEVATVDESPSKASSDNSENETLAANDSNTQSPPPSPTQKENAIPPKPVELPNEPSTVCTLTEEILKKQKVPTDHHTTSTPLPKQDSNSSQVPIRSIPQPNSGPNTENDVKASKSSEPIKPTEISQPIIDHPLDETIPEPFSEAPSPIQTLTHFPNPTASTEPLASQANESETKEGIYEDNGDGDDDDNAHKDETIPEPFSEAPSPIQTLTPFPDPTASTEPPVSQANEPETREGIYEGNDDDNDDHKDETISESFSEAPSPIQTLTSFPDPTASTELLIPQVNEPETKEGIYEDNDDVDDDDNDHKDETISEPFSEASRPIKTLTPFPNPTASTEPPVSQANESETKEGVYEDDDDDDDDHDNVFKTITQRLTKLEKDFGLLQDYLQVQTSEFNRALLDFQDDQKDQLIKSYLFLNSTLNRELYALRRLQGEGWSKLMDVIDVVGERSKNEVNLLREELNTIQFIVKWLVLGEFILILGIIIIYIIFKWFKSNHHSSSSINMSAKAELKSKIKQN
ncbi:hypothetical protein CONCODRAFT_80389 [Conidiobolus coronatus NRRL 28638]|uniref:SUN domain-containing protein n=1 Tax=Conidiobolus coronatus (strain ATCC 28846 / CBS 209.66 / NRRL 28638) TaxID=796925 RepID=A0A137NVK0_CONC2|nr:hypothetical protein CONCODRAFT_80389 [Conidiobolus coronatus NRRL 28638]|eukprot:KXN66792.1 hypothetical protein CONCODRAFT_80389 [Conidiobolus coronatus NRRL 28638]